jgi:hypothetical protein
MRLLLSLVLCGTMIVSARAETVAAPESRKIEYLIGSIERLSDAEFVRNGSAYDAKAAADHLRLKLRRAGRHVGTAEDFIRVCASKSSTSGNAYQIRFGDGTVMTSEAFLRRKLAEFDKLER